MRPLSSPSMGAATIAIERVYVGRPAPLGDPRLGVTSGIAKAPVAPGLMIELAGLNLAGDEQADRTVHGGVDKAVYVHPSEHLPRWAVDLGQPQLSEPGLDVAPFGE